jgi:hypothetical protein
MSTQPSVDSAHVSLGDGVAAVRQPADRQRPEAPRVAHGDHVVGGEQHERERPLPRRQRALDALLPGLAAGGGEHQRHHLGIAGGGEAEAPVQQLVAQRRRVDEVAVVGEASGPCIVSTRNGWMLRSAFDPVVEYRVWPIAW